MKNVDEKQSRYRNFSGCNKCLSPKAIDWTDGRCSYLQTVRTRDQSSAGYRTGSNQTSNKMQQSALAKRSRRGPLPCDQRAHAAPTIKRPLPVAHTNVAAIFGTAPAAI